MLAKKILVVEDSDSLRRVLAERLREAEFTILEASGGSDGLRLAQAEKPDMIITDIIMYPMDGLEMVKKCDIIYIENYTSLLQCSVADIEKFYGKKVILANREKTEQQSHSILQEAKDKEVAFLVVGDPFSATTHIELFKEAREKKIPIRIIHNASILTAVGITGLQLYKFGRTISIPFQEDVPTLEGPYNIIRENGYLGLHTLCLLDLKPEKNKWMNIQEALSILERIETQKKENTITSKMIVVGCARLGSSTQLIRFGSLEKIKKIDFGKPPHCLIIPAKLHFMEKEVLDIYAIGR